MDILSAFPSTYLKVADLDGKPLLCVIDYVETAEVGPEREVKPVVHFRDSAKPWIFNKTNADTLIDLYGRNTDAWSGCSVVLIQDRTTYAGKRVPCIRIDEKASKPSKKMTPAKRAEVVGDEIPF